MKNILSYHPCTRLSGSEIKAWIFYHSKQQTSHTHEARKMLKYMNIKDDNLYIIRRGTYQEEARSFQVVNAR